jgi:WD40 repeat protein
MQVLSLSHARAQPNPSFLLSFFAVCLGTLNGHSDAVNSMVALTANSFASCGSDGLVALWKVGLLCEVWDVCVGVCFVLRMCCAECAACCKRTQELFFLRVYVYFRDSRVCICV